MITYNTIIGILKGIADNHGQIKSFGEGDPSEQEAAPDRDYPAMWVVPQQVVFPITQPVLNLPVKIIISDQPSDNRSDETEIRSDTLAICQDIVAKLKNDPAYGDYFELVSATADPFNEKDQDVLTGWILDITLSVNYTADYCAVPAG